MREISPVHPDVIAGAMLLRQSWLRHQSQCVVGRDCVRCIHFAQRNAELRFKQHKLFDPGLEVLLAG